MSTTAKTKLIFQLSSHQGDTHHATKVTTITSYNDLPDADKLLFKLPQDLTHPIFAVTTESTIFHPQGGGQPSDVGQFSVGQDTIFNILMVRPSSTQTGVVLHFGHFSSAPSLDIVGQAVEQTVDGEKRLLYSRLHTAGHVLGAATRNLLEDKIENFDELKASHFPDSAGCEFQGSIDGKYKPDVQGAVDELVAKDAEVRIEWWTKDDFRTKGVARLIPEDSVWTDIAVAVDENGAEQAEAQSDEETRIRVVNIIGAEVYPCGGTHVPSTKGCGKVTVRKISRTKGTSRISYAVDS